MLNDPTFNNFQACTGDHCQSSVRTYLNWISTHSAQCSADSQVQLMAKVQLMDIAHVFWLWFSIDGIGIDNNISSVKF